MRRHTKTTNDDGSVRIPVLTMTAINQSLKEDEEMGSEQGDIELEPLTAAVGSRSNPTHNNESSPQCSPLMMTNFIIIVILLCLTYRFETALVSMKSIEVNDNEFTQKDGAVSIKSIEVNDNEYTQKDGAVSIKKTVETKNLPKYIVLASNHGMGSSSTAKVMGKMHPCMIYVGEGFTSKERIVEDTKLRKESQNTTTLFDLDGTFLGAGREQEQFQMQLRSKNKKKLKHIDADELYPKEATDVLDWFTQLHDNLSRMNKNSIPECKLAHPIITMKMFPQFLGNFPAGVDNFEMIREFMSSSDTLVVHQTRNYTDARASNMRRFGHSAGGEPVDEEWDTWLEGSGINMIDVKVEDIWAAGKQGYRALMEKICDEAGIPVNELVSFDELFSDVTAGAAKQHAKTKAPNKNGSF